MTSGLAHATVTVADDGEGIQEKDRERVFESFERASDGPHRPGSVGLGLSVSRNLARAMGGEVSYRYEHQKSIFQLTLPVADPPSDEATSPQHVIRYDQLAYQTFRDLTPPPKRGSDAAT